MKYALLPSIISMSDQLSPFIVSMAIIYAYLISIINEAESSLSISEEGTKQDTQRVLVQHTFL